MKKISISNFRGIKSLDIDTTKLNVLTASNGSGKSSVIDSIHWFITGEIKDDDIRHGTNEAMITIEFDSGTKMTRTRKKGEGLCYSNGSKIDCKTFDQLILQELHCTAATAAALCGTDFLDSLSTKDMTAFLLSILPIKVQSDDKVSAKEKIISYMEEAKGKALMPDEKAYAESLLTLNEYSLSDISDIYDNVFATRRVRKKDLAEVKEKAKFDTALLPQETLKELDAKLEDIAKKEALAQDYNKRLNQYNNSLENYNRANNRKKFLEEELKKYESVSAPDKKVLEEAESDKKKFQEAIVPHQTRIHGCEKGLKDCETAYKNVSNPNKVCPLTSAKCDVDFTPFIEKIIEKGKEYKNYYNEDVAFVERCNKEIADRDAIIKAYNEQNLLWTKKESLLNEYNNIVIPTLPEKPEEYKADDLNSLKAEINTKKKIYTSFEQSQLYAKQTVELSREVEILELMVKMFDIKGIKSLLLKKALTPVEQIVNAGAEKLRPDFKIKLLGDNGLDVQIYPDGKTPVNMNKVSSGEFILTAYMLMGAIHDITGVSFLVIDDMDRLDKENAKAFMNLIEKDNRFSTVILAGVNHTDFTDAIPDTANTINL